MANHSADSVTSGGEVLTGIEVIGMLGEVLTNAGGHSKTQVGVDVDLANCALCSLIS